MRNFTITHRLVLAVAFGAVLPASLAAREKDSGAENLGAENLAEESDVKIVVTGTGLSDAPASPAYGPVELSRDQIVTSASGRVEDVLSSIAGLQQFRRSDSRSANPSAQGVTLRGLGGNATSRALVLLDGIPMADPFFGYIPFSAIAPDALQSVRVTRGGGAGPFGAGALSGVIELESADADMLGLISASMLANNRGETEASMAIAPKLGDGFAVVTGRWDRGQGFYTAPQADRVPASARAGFENWSLGFRAAMPVSGDVELQARGLVFHDERTLRFAGADSSSEGADASVRLVGRGRWQFDALAYVQARNFSNIVVSSTRFVPVLDQRNTPSTGIGGKLEVRPPVGNDHILRIGVDYRRSSGELQEDAYSAFSRRLTERRRAGGVNSDMGLFIEDDWTLGNLVLTGGLRADRSIIEEGFYRAVDASGQVVSEAIAPDRKGWSLSYRGGAMWQMAPALRVRAAAYRGLRLPTLNELYRPFVVFPIVTQANAALKNEYLEGVELGADFEPFSGGPFSGMKLAVTIFDNRLKNAIANVTIAPNLRERQNLPAIDTRGIEAGLTFDMGQVRFEGSASYSSAKIDGRGSSAALNGLRPAQTPAFAADAVISWKPAEGWMLKANLRHIAKQFESDQESDILPAVTVFNAFAQIPVAGRFSLIFRGENLFDADIVTRNSGGSVDLGVPRTIWGGIRFGF